MQTLVESLEGVIQISTPAYPDDRGFFKEVLRISEIEKATGKQFIVKQVNHSKSAKNTLRGVHVAPWNKVIYVTKGKVQSVIVDLREGSPTYGKHISVVLGDENRSCIFVPANCGNAYLVLSDEADYIYLTDEEWSPNREKGIAWNDPTLAIEWQIKEEPVLSEKDKSNPPFSAQE